MANPEHVEILKQGVDVWNKWREDNPDIEPDLENANLFDSYLEYANLANADLNHAKLEYSDLRNSNLRNADLEYSVLSNAILHKADLYYAKLEFTKLSNANLSEALLNRTIFDYANITNSIWDNADVGETYFINMDLSENNVDLGKVHHSSKSYIDVQTFYLSKANIPEEFLFKAGIPKTYIQYIKSIVEAENILELYSCFMSYSHADKSFVHKLYKKLIKAEIRCFLDEKSMIPGDRILREIDKAIRLYDKVILICSENSLNSWWVRNELKKTLRKERDYMKEHKSEIDVLIPIMIDDSIFDWDDPMRDEVEERFIADFTNWQDDEAFEAEVQELMKALRPNRELTDLDK